MIKFEVQPESGYLMAEDDKYIHINVGVLTNY